MTHFEDHKIRYHVKLDKIYFKKIICVPYDYSYNKIMCVPCNYLCNTFFEVGNNSIMLWLYKKDKIL